MNQFVFLFYIIFNLIFSISSFAGAIESVRDIKIELGETFPLTQRFHKIWVENKKIISIQMKNNKYFIKSLQPGLTHFRLNNTLYTVRVLPIGSKRTYSNWKILSKKFIGLNVNYCSYSICLEGTLYRLKDYIRLLDEIEKNDSILYLSLNIDSEIENSLRKFIADRLRQIGMTPLKVQFSKPWKIYYPKSKFKNEHKTEAVFRSLGLKSEYWPEITPIADNIKVAVKIVEVTKNFEHKLGVHWPDNYQAQIIDPLKLKWAESFDLAISAAEKEGEAKILASPNLICRSGKEADFFAGGEFPIKVLSLRSKEIQWKRYGIGLKLKPIIDPLGQMSLHIETEVSTLDRSITVDDMPALHTNRVSSYFDLINSRTIAISGLIKSEVSESSEGLPFLKNIPILGRLFSSKNFQENKSELIIFVTPELME